MNTANSPMTVLITGGTGFVMSNIVKHLLESNPAARVVILDLGPVKGVVADFFEPVQERLTSYQGDIRDTALLNRISEEWPITHIVHAAMVAHFPQWELETPAKFIEVNTMGTVNVLEWARQLENLQRFLYVSSGGVYGDPTPESSTGPQPEDGPFNPPELYAISKFTAEQIVRRYGELFEMDTRRVRFSGVFGPMERYTPGRVTMAMPYYMVRSVIEQRPFRLTAETLEAGGDFLSAEDIAFAMLSIILANQPQYDVYNIAYGTFTMVPEVLEAFKRVVPSFEYEVVEPVQADVIMDPNQRLARWNAYLIDRISSEFGWQPRALAEQLDSYYEWVMIDPEIRCPQITKPSSLLV